MTQRKRIPSRTFPVKLNLSVLQPHSSLKAYTPTEDTTKTKSFRATFGELVILLNFVEGDNVATLDVFVGGLDCEVVFNEVVYGNKVINNCHHNCQLLNSVSNCNQF